jgi:putative endonuclease
LCFSVRNWLAARFRRKSLGVRGEDFAARFLKRKGYHILARHLDLPLGELDIVAVDERTVVFVEVKTRATTDAGEPAEAIDAIKQARMTRAALAYLKAHGLLKYSARFDVVAIVWPAGAWRPSRTDHFENAFEAVGHGQLFR